MEVLLHAQSLFRGGSFQRAAQLLEDHMACQPRDFRVAVALGRVYRHLQQPEKAAYWLHYSLQSYYGLPDIDEEDVEYLAEASEEEVVFGLDHEYGVDANASEEAASDESAQQGELESRISVEKEIGPPDSEEGNQTVDLEAGSGECLSYQELSELQNDLPELFEENDNDEADLELFYVEPDADCLGQEDDLDETHDRLDHREKAQLVAVEIAVEAGWLKKDTDILVEVLAYHRSHGKTRSALRDLLIEKEVTPSELAVLHDLRQLWGGGGYNRTYRNNKAKEGWPGVSWQIGLRIIRGLRVDSAEEAILFVDSCFEEWGASPKQLNAFPAFTHYLEYILAHMERVSERCGQAVPAYIELEFFEEPDDGYEQWYEPRFSNGYMIDKVMPGEEDWLW